MSSRFLFLELLNMIFTADWFSEHIPIWEREVLPRMTRRPAYLEIGSFEGRSLLWMLDHVPDLQATSIDPQLIDGDASWNRLTTNVGTRARLFRETNRIGLVKLICPSLSLQIEKYDAIYIDGSHWTDDVLFDSVLSWSLLKIGGVMIWDDYEWTFGREEREHPKPAVDAFLACYRGCYKILHTGYQVLVEKTAESCHV